MTVGKIFGLMLGIHRFFDVFDDPFNLGAESLFVPLVKLRDPDAFLLTDVELSLERVIFCLGYGCIGRCGVVVG